MLTVKQGKSEDQDVGRQITNLQTSASGVRDRGCLVHVETGIFPTAVEERINGEATQRKTERSLETIVLEVALDQWIRTFP